MSAGLRAAPVLEPAVGSYYSLAAPRARPRRYLSRKDTAMPYRINHIHLKASDPRKTADWYVKAFAFKIVSENLEADIKRLEGLGAKLLEGPIEIPGGPRICFVQAPDDVRLELIQRSKTAIAGGCC